MYVTMLIFLFSYCGSLTFKSNTIYGRTYFIPTNPGAALRASDDSSTTSIQDFQFNIDDESPLKQLRFYYNCDNIDSDIISEFILEAGALSVSCEIETEKENYLNMESKWGDLAKIKSWQTAVLRANFPNSFDTNGLVDMMRASFSESDFEIEFLDVADRDWISYVQSSWKPVIIGGLRIKFPWHTDSEMKAEEGTDVVSELILEGGAAFGTGDHPTTRLCCRWLQREVTVASRKPSVLDYGCGSAILGLAALRYGASKASGVDIDRDSLASAKRNCQLNYLHMDLFVDDSEDDDKSKSIEMNTFRGGRSNELFTPVDVLRSSGECYDLIVANILAPALIALAPSLAKLTVSGLGKIALSGLLMNQAEVVMNSYRPYFNDMKVEDQEEGWVVLTGIRKGLEL